VQANEQLQHFSALQIFAWELKDLADENIPLDGISYPSNRELLEQLFKTPMGFFKLLDEETYFPRGTDSTFRSKVHKAFKKCGALVFPKRTAHVFSVKHYAADVTYDCTGFLRKNRNALPVGLKTLLALSPVNLVSILFCADLTQTGSLDLSLKETGPSGGAATAAAPRAGSIGDQDPATGCADEVMMADKPATAAVVSSPAAPAPLPTTKNEQKSRLQMFRSSTVGAPFDLALRDFAISRAVLPGTQALATPSYAWTTLQQFKGNT
jgi:hypothetical protein